MTFCLKKKEGWDQGGQPREDGGIFERKTEANVRKISLQCLAL